MKNPFTTDQYNQARPTRTLPGLRSFDWRFVLAMAVLPLLALVLR